MIQKIHLQLRYLVSKPPIIGPSTPEKAPTPPIKPPIIGSILGGLTSTMMTMLNAYKPEALAP